MLILEHLSGSILISCQQFLNLKLTPSYFYQGGVSSGSWSVNEEEGYGVEDGTVRDVPSLQAPGFIKATAHGRFNDASSAISGDLILHIRSSTAEYTGYRVSFGGTWNAFNDFKADFTIEAGDDFSEVRIPFNMFSSKWDPGTGDQTVTCAEDPKVCPTVADLGRIRRIELWAEGVKGEAHMEVKSISAGQKQPQVKSTIKTLSSSEISLVTFDGEPSTTFKFMQVNDPVMVSSIQKVHSTKKRCKTPRTNNQTL